MCFCQNLVSVYCFEMRMWMSLRVAHGAQRQQKRCTKKKANIYQKTNSEIPLSQNMWVSLRSLIATHAFVWNFEFLLYFWCGTFAHLCCKNLVQKPSGWWCNCDHNEFVNVWSKYGTKLIHFMVNGSLRKQTQNFTMFQTQNNLSTKKKSKFLNTEK